MARDSGTPYGSVKTYVPPNKTPAQKINDFIRNPFPAIGSAITNAFKSTVPQYNQPRPYGPPVPQFHQVTANDTSMHQISNQYGLPLQQLTDLNRSKTLPPKGSYIQLTPAQTAYATGGGNQAYQPLANNFANVTGGGNINTNPFATQGRGDASAQTLRNQATAISQQILAGNDPTQIPSSVIGFIKKADGTSLTIQDLVKEGYVMNSQGIMVKSGTPGAGGKLGQPSADFMNTQAYRTGTGAGVDFLNQSRYDPQTKKYHSIRWFLERGKLNIHTGRASKGKPRFSGGGGGGRAAAPAAPVTTVPVATNTEGPQTILDLHLGSG